VFLDLHDRTGRIQIMLGKKQVGPEAWKIVDCLDLGDLVGIDGRLGWSKTGEMTVFASGLTFLTKSLETPPDKFHGLVDPDLKQRMRYLDLIHGEGVRDRFVARSRIVEAVRRVLAARGYLEVEGPTLQESAGGAAARPFTTHHNALNVDFVLRISLELYLKRLLVAGYDRVFEIGRNFRNEGISRRHNPEFTMLEVYQAYSDYRGMMVLIKNLLTTLCLDVLGTSEIKHAASGEMINFGGPWREVKYKDLIREVTGDAQWFERSKAEKVAGAEKLELYVDPKWEEFEITNEIFSKKIEPTLIQPTFVTHLPKELCPLAKITLDDPTTIDVFELCIGGMEIAPAYSEQNDPAVQRQMFEAQSGGDQQAIDQDFLLALEHGMPPAGGMGVGIDRLCILLTGAESIRDVILFPQLRPGGGA